MIYWMSENTNEQLDRFNVSVTGFDPEREGDDARCMVEWGDDECGIVKLGDIRNLTEAEIDRRFAAGLRGLAKGEGSDILDEAATLCLAPYLKRSAA